MSMPTQRRLGYLPRVDPIPTRSKIQNLPGADFWCLPGADLGMPTWSKIHYLPGAKFSEPTWSKFQCVLGVEISTYLEQNSMLTRRRLATYPEQITLLTR